MRVKVALGLFARRQADSYEFEHALEGLFLIFTCYTRLTLLTTTNIDCFPLLIC